MVTRRPATRGGGNAQGVTTRPLDGKTFGVTGASSGRGARMARFPSGRGTRVIAAARRTEVLEAPAAGHRDIRAPALDMAGADSVAPTVRRAAADPGGIDGLVTDAGTARGAAGVNLSGSSA